MEWRKADVVWNRDVWPGGMAEDLSGIADNMEVALSGGWVHLRGESGVRTYPSRLVFRIIWHDQQAAPNVW